MDSSCPCKKPTPFVAIPPVPLETINEFSRLTRDATKAFDTEHPQSMASEQFCGSPFPFVVRVVSNGNDSFIAFRGVRDGMPFYLTWAINVSSESMTCKLSVNGTDYTEQVYKAIFAEDGSGNVVDWVPENIMISTNDVIICALRAFRGTADGAALGQCIAMNLGNAAAMVSCIIGVIGTSYTFLTCLRNSW